jgi:PAS domain S-box-containing protein
MIWIQSTLITLSLASGFVSLWLVNLSHGKQVPGVAELRLLLWLLAGWSFVYAVILAIDSPLLMVALHRIKLSIISWAGLAWIVLTLRIINTRHIISKRLIILLAIPPMISGFLSIINPQGLFFDLNIVYSSLGFTTVYATPQLIAPLYWLVTFGYAIAGIILFSWWLYKNSHKGMRISPFAWVFILFFTFSVISALYIAREYYIDIIPLTSSVINYVIAIGILQLRVFDLLPMAYDNIIANMNDGIIITNTRQHIHMINHTIERFSGLKQENVKNRAIFSVFPDLPNTKNDISSYELTWDKISLSISKTTIYDYYNQVQGYLWVFQNISERKQAELSLKENIKQLSELQRLATQMSNIQNVDEILTISFNAALQLTKSDEGYIILFDEHTQITNKYYSGVFNFSLIDPDVAEVVDKHIEKISISGPRHRIIFPLVSHETLLGLLMLESHKSNTFDDRALDFIRILTGRISVAIENAKLYQQAQDQINELKKLYDQVSHLEQIKTDMIRIAAHDLRNPLSVLTAYISMMQMDSHLFPPDYVDYIEQMLTAARRIAVMISEILSLERIERMAQELTAEPFDIVLSTTEAYDEYKRQAMDKNITLTMETNVPNAIVYGDPIQIYEAMVNLINNAIKYTPEGGKILVSLQVVTTGSVVFLVQDNGYGIPADQQDKLFKAFSRAKTSETQAIEGLGLGLSLVKSIIDRHAGELFFESVYEQGSVFGFTLDIYQ